VISPKKRYHGLRYSQQWIGNCEFAFLDEDRMMHTIDPWYGTSHNVGDRAFSTSDLAWHPEYKIFFSYEDGHLCAYDKIDGKLTGSSAFDIGEDGINMVIVAPFDNKTFVVQDDTINAVNIEFTRRDERKIDRRQHGFQIR
jgi:hypothetical protein